jgi:DNA integrity scanning protein DisA with diadenylate cyclase activity
MVIRAFDGSKVALPLELKMRTSELILRLMERKRHFGLFVILGWQQKKWQEYLDISDSQQDIFAEHHVDIMKLKPGEKRSADVAATINFDGAILIDKKGTIVHSGAMIEGMRPRVVAQKLNPGKFNDLSEQFGFTSKVHTRHLSAIAASYVFKGTTVFTVSEENDSFHIYEGGRIVLQD